VKLFGIANPPQWLADYSWAMPAVILMTIWGGLGYAILIYSAAIQTLPKDLYEAADIDGAGPVRTFVKVTVPLLSPTTFFLVVTYFITSFQVFAQIQVMTRGGPGTSTHVLVYYIFTTAFTFYRMGYAAAISWVLFLILFAITMIQMRGQKKWVTYA
jgi:multiple sugar transport system permease protein